MSAIQDVPNQAAYNRAFDVLTDNARRRIVRILRQRAGPISEEDLAERLADAATESAVEGDTAESERSEDTAPVDRLRVRLRHLHLPKLEASGLVTWDQEGEAVREANHPSIDNGSLDALVSVDEERGSIADALADERRRTILEVVSNEADTLDRSTLARAVAERDADDPSASTVREVETQLHHRHLPQLEDAGLIAYETDAATVSYEGPEAVSSLLPVLE